MSATIKSSIRRHFSKSRGREITDITPGVGRSNDKEPLSFVIRHPTVCRQYRPTTGHRHLRTCIYLGINLCPSVSKIQRIRFSLSKILGKDTRALVRSFSPLILSFSLSPHLASISSPLYLRFFSLLERVLLSPSPLSPPPSRIDLRLFFWKPYIFRFTVRGAVECPASIQTRVHLRSSRQV